jgi:LuxR family transcriptional regulator, maltose regulon positive regulatory protein
MFSTSSASGTPVLISPTKLAPSVQRTVEVRRNRLSDRMSLAAGAKLALIRAPAGFGKTTAMVQLRESLEQAGVATAWLTLDRADNDVPRFLASLTAAIEQLGLGFPAGSGRDVLNDLSVEQSPFALFLDDLEVVREGGVMGIVRELIERLPRNGRLIIGTRSLPDLALGRLRARGQLLEIDADALRFTNSEAAEFFKLRGAELSLEALDRAQERTEGWGAALWLLSLALQRQGSHSDVVARLSASNQDVADYLTEEVLGQQDAPVRDFLLRTSVLRHLSVPACQALIPQVDCMAMMKHLEHGNVFLIPMEDESYLFRYHSLFADFLRRVLSRETPDEFVRLHLAASRWYESQGRPVPAIDHAIEGGDPLLALGLLRTHAAMLLQQGRIRLLDRWFTAVPSNLLKQQPHLQVIAIWARCLSQGAGKATDLLEVSGCSSSLDPQVQVHVRALLPVLFAMQDRYEEAHAAGLDALACLPSGDAFIDGVILNAMAHIEAVVGERQEAHRFLENARQSQGSSAYNRMYTETVSGMLDLREGRLRQATARFRMAVTSSSTVATYNYIHGNAWAGVPYAAVLYEANDIVTAERLLNVYLPLARDVGLPDHMIASYRMRSRMAFQQGEVDIALQLITELEYIGLERQLPRVTASAKLERSRLLALQGHGFASREELVRACDQEVWKNVRQHHRPAQEVDDVFASSVRIEIHFGQPQTQVAPLEDEIRRTHLSGWRHRELKLRLFLALAHMRSADVGRAIDTAIPMLQEASREGFLRLLLDEGPIVAQLVRCVQTSSTTSVQDPIFQDYLNRLMELLGPLSPEEEAAPFGASNALAEPLTRKELRVLQLLAEGYSNTAMAEKLFVSESTVRTHLRNINTKLECHSRTQAVAIARKLGLLQ